MMFGSTNGGGQNAAIAPDVCKTPSPGGPVPIPYPNFATVAQAVKYASKVKFSSRNALPKTAKVSMTNGDQPGTLGGIKSNVVMNKSTWLKGSSKVKVQGKKVVYHTAMTGHNGSNTNITGMQVAPSQTSVLVAM